MSQIRNSFLGAAAVLLIIDAVQFASGHDLGGGAQIAAIHPEISVNRAAKADRIGEPKPAAAPTRTISLRHRDLAEISVLIRVPVTQEARETKPEPVMPAPPASVQSRPTIACEPVVSVLTEVAKRLQPGRCVT